LRHAPHEQVGSRVSGQYREKRMVTKMKLIRSVFVGLAATALALLAAGCGGRGGFGLGRGGLHSAGIPSMSEPREVADVLAELGKMRPPQGTAEDVFEQLKAALADALRSRAGSRIVSAAPEMAGATVDTAVPYDAGAASIRFSWNEHNPGDYDLSGEVNLRDLALVATYFDKREGDEGWALARVADGNGDKRVGAEDAAVIGADYLGRISGYNVYRSLPGGSAPDLLGKVARDAALVLGGVCVQYSYEDAAVESVDTVYAYEVRPYANPDGTGEGAASQTWELRAGDSYGAAPVHAVEIVVDDSGLQRQVVAGELLLTYRYNPTREQLLHAVYGEVGGEVIGQLAGTQTYRVRLPKDASRTLSRAVSQLKGASSADGFSLDYNYIVPGPAPVEHVEGTEDFRAASMSYSDPLRGQLWGLDAVQADNAWDIGEGGSIVVAVIDTGVKASHEDLAGQTVAGARFGGSEAWNDDTAGHGTHVAGTIAAAAGNARGVAGLANKAKIMPLRCGAVYGSAWSFPVSDLTAAVNYAVQNGARVINMSLGGQGTLGTAFETALLNAESNGVVVLAAAGNDNVSAQGFYPATYPTVVSVGAIGPAFQRAPFSNYGYPQYVDVCAPGGDGTYSGAILSTVIASNSSYDRMQGTSMACPHASAEAALILGVNPGLTPVEVRQIMQSTGRTIAASSQVGPLIDAQAALASLGAPGTHSIAGSVKRGDGTGVPGVTLALTGGASKSAPTDVGGNFTLTGVADGSYTLTPVRLGYTFTPPSLGVSVSGAAVASQDFVAVQSAGAESENNDTWAQANALPDLPFTADMFAGSLGSGTGYAANDGDATDFCKFAIAVPSRVTFSMAFNSGTGDLSLYLLAANGSAVLASSATSDATETVAASLSSAGTYYVKCTRVSGYSDYTLAGSVQPTYSVSGKVTKLAGGAALANVTLTLAGNGLSFTAKSGSAGTFSIAGAPDGVYALTPGLTGRSFAPPSRSITLSGGNVAGQDFAAEGPFTVSGTVFTTAGPGLAGATLTLFGGGLSLTATSGTGGAFIVQNVPNGSYVLVCTAKGRSFSPASIDVTVASGNVSGCYFLGEGPFSVSGSVTTTSGTPLVGVSLRLEGGGYSLTAATSALGKFTVSGAPNGTYILTPSSRGRTFTPANRTVAVQNGNVSGVAFTGEGPFTVSGKVTNQADGLPVSGVKLTLTGGGLALTASTSATGDYTITFVPNGTYTLMAARTGRAFEPLSKTVAVSSANAAGQSFTSYPVFSVTGRVTLSGAALAGVDLGLVGGNAYAATTNASGVYTLTGVRAGSYALTPSLAGRSFTPAARNVSITTANVASQNFAAQ
jgi:subtilisin family serine protease